ncbi:hypothetical protein ACFL0H_12185 [Thermodesulfobacteriota bacterium]
MAQNVLPERIIKLQHNNPQFADIYLAQSEKILKDGAIPAKYKILMT